MPKTLIAVYSPQNMEIIAILFAQNMEIMAIKK